MELLLKRNEKPGALGTRYDLFAKLEAKPEEVARIPKAKPDKTVIVMRQLDLQGHSREEYSVTEG